MDISAYQHMNIRMSTRGKRPLRNLTPSDKVRAIQRIHNGETKASVSRDIGVPESTLRGWCKNEQKLRFMCRQLGTDQMSVNCLDTPPEKRLKYENSNTPLKLNAGVNQEDFGYSRPQLSPMDFATNNAILEKIAFNDFLEKNSQTADVTSKQLSSNGHLPSAFNPASLPAEFSQLAMMQNFNLLSLLNSNLATLPTMYADSTASQEDCKPKTNLRVSSAVDDFKNNSNSNSSNGSSTTTSSSPTLSVKNWAKDPSENSVPVNFTTAKHRNPNDNNNNDVKPKLQFPSTPFGQAAMFPNIFPGCLPPFPTPSEDSESSNAALMDWCKLFNASLNYIALAAAAAALHQPGAMSTSSPSELHLGKSAPERAIDKILLKHLTQDSRSFPSPGHLLANSDISNDSYFDSEPEDLSVRSTNSKISSPANSRSQSPTLLTSSSAHSDVE